MSSTTKVAKQIAETNPKYPKAYKYDVVLREFDNKVELIGLVDDPTYDIADFRGRQVSKQGLRLANKDSHRTLTDADQLHRR